MRKQLRRNLDREQPLQDRLPGPFRFVVNLLKVLYARIAPTAAQDMSAFTLESHSQPVANIRPAAGSISRFAIRTYMPARLTRPARRME